MEIEIADQARIYKGAAELRNQLSIAEKENERRKKRLSKLKQEVIRRYKVLRQVQDELTSTLKRTKNNDDDQVDNEPSSDRKAKRTKEVRSLAKTFNAMKPAQAAKVIEVMDEDLVVDVLRLVKPRQSGKILGAVKPEIAARISEQMTSTRRSRKRSN
jgi:flagellar motility protein MotE (MotC chaperone)